MCSKYWCSLRWYLRAASWASFCRADTWASKNCSLLFHLSLAMRASCSRVALLSSSLSATVRRASTQQCCSFSQESSADSRSPQPIWQTPWPASASANDAIVNSPALPATFSTQEVAQSVRIVSANGERRRLRKFGQSFSTSLTECVAVTQLDRQTEREGGLRRSGWTERLRHSAVLPPTLQ